MTPEQRSEIAKKAAAARWKPEHQLLFLIKGRTSRFVRFKTPAKQTTTDSAGAHLRGLSKISACRADRQLGRTAKNIDFWIDRSPPLLGF